MLKQILSITALLACSSLLLAQSFVQGPFTSYSIGQSIPVDINADDRVDVVGLERFGFGTVGDLVIYTSTSTADSISFDILDVGVRGIGAATVGDLDGDNDLDIIVSEWDGSQAVIVAMYNDGDLQFMKDTIALDNLYRHHIADLDGDGDVDIVGSNRDDDVFMVYLNDGNQTYSRTDSFSSDTFIAVRLEDYDQDGDIDILGFNDGFRDSGVDFYANDGAGRFTLETSLESPVSRLSTFQVVDFDDNGLTDILVAGSNSTRLAALMQTAVGVYEVQEIASASGAITAFVAGNFDQSNGLDIVFARNNNGLEYLSNLESGLYDFDDGEEVSGISTVQSIVPADLDGDGDDDIIVSNGDFWWLTNEMPQGPVNTSETQQSDVSVFPNPFTDIVYLRNLPQQALIEVINSSGALVHREPAADASIDLSKLPAGAYWLKVTDSMGNHMATHRLVKVER